VQETDLENCTNFYVQNPDRCILIDDETYIKMDTHTLPGPQFYTVVGESVRDEEKFEYRKIW